MKTMVNKNMKIQLSVFERIILLEILDRFPKDFINKKVIERIEDQLSFSDSELYELEIHSENEEIVWRSEFDNPKIILFGNFGYNLVKDCLSELENKMDDSHKTLIDKFKKC